MIRFERYNEMLEKLNNWEFIELLYDLLEELEYRLLSEDDDNGE